MQHWEVNRQAALVHQNWMSPKAAVDPAHLSLSSPAATRRGDAIEVSRLSSLASNRENTAADSECGSKDIDSTPTNNIVWRAGRAALVVGEKKSGLIQYCSTSRNIVTQLWPRTPQQCHGASDVRRRHRCAAKTCIIIVGAIVA